MKVGELIKLLQDFDPLDPVAIYVDGEKMDIEVASVEYGHEPEYPYVYFVGLLPIND